MEENLDIRFIDAFQTSMLEMFKTSEQPIILIGLTTKKESDLPSSIVRMFLDILLLESPKSNDTYQILSWFVSDLGLVCSADVLTYVSAKATGYVFADLGLLVRHALRFQRSDEELPEDEKYKLLKRHFDKAIGTFLVLLTSLV